MRVSVLIVNWNGEALLASCLQSLRDQAMPPHEVIVVDNGSRDNSVAFLKQYRWSKLKTLFLSENTGFSGGNNAGYPLITGDVVALINNDAVAQPEWILQAVPLFRDPKVGMVACKSLRFEDTQTIDKAGHLIYPDGLNRGRGTGLPDGESFQKRDEALWPDGCAGFYLKSMIDEIGFFDKDFFLYGEDAELGMRARWAGYRCLYQPLSVVLHRHSTTLGKASSQKVYFIERNRLWVLIKTFPLTYVVVSPWFTCLRYLMNLASLLLKKGAASNFRREQSSGSLFSALVRAVFHGILGIPNMCRKRRRIIRRISTKEMKRLLRRYRISVSELTLQD